MYSLIVPVYCNEESIPGLLDTITGLAAKLPAASFEAVFVVDGSPDRSYELLSASLDRCHFRSRLLLLSRNFGSFAAIRAGLQDATGPCFAVMAADLQEPPELVLEFFQRLATGEADVIMGARAKRDDPFHTRLFSRVFWAAYRRFVFSEIPPGGVDIFGCNRLFRDHLLALKEVHTSLVAQLFWLGFTRKVVYYERQARRYGKSAWTMKKKFRYLMDSIFSFSDLPIRILFILGVAGMLISTLVALIVFICKVTGYIAVPGYTATVLVISFFAALNFFGLGIIGSYAWRTFENTKNRPNAIVVKRFDFKAGGGR